MHYSVLLKESIDLLAIKADGVYIDGTFGRGGHSREILARLGDNGRLIAFDKDPEAVKYGLENIKDPRLTIVHDSFVKIKAHLERLQIQEVDGVLLDLGVSSPQLDSSERGFSFRFDALLDMRMNNQEGESAGEWLNTASEIELAKVFWEYGEEKFARKIAKAIVDKRVSLRLTTTKQLADLVAGQIPYKEKGQHPATRVFQAIRIYINNELDDLEQVLNEVPQLLKVGGKIVVISFHSLEDRIVKTKFMSLATKDKLPKWVMSNNEEEPEFKVIAKKVKAGEDEIAENVRSRSATLRGLERVNVKNR